MLYKLTEEAKKRGVAGVTVAGKSYQVGKDGVLEVPGAFPHHKAHGFEVHTPATKKPEDEGKEKGKQEKEK